VLTLDDVLDTLTEFGGVLSDYVCDYLCDEEEEICYAKCEWSCPQKECWVRYFERLKNEAD